MFQYLLENKEVESNIDYLRNEFPECYYSQKGNDVLIMSLLTDNSKYSEWKTNDKGIKYRVSSNWDLSRFEKLKDLEKMQVILANGVRLKLIPVSSTPRKVFFGRKETELDEWTKKGFELFELIKKDEIKELKDQEMNFILEGIKRSYHIKEEIINELGITDRDLVHMLFALLGIDPEILKKN